MTTGASIHDPVNLAFEVIAQREAYEVKLQQNHKNNNRNLNQEVAVSASAANTPSRKANTLSQGTLLHEYKNEPVSWFQKKIRGDACALTDHISKEMNVLNVIRCQRIPKCNGISLSPVQAERAQVLAAAQGLTDKIKITCVTCYWPVRVGTCLFVSWWVDAIKKPHAIRVVPSGL